MRWWWLSCVMWVVGCSSSDDLEVNRTTCVTLRDHLVELRLKEAAAGVDLRAHGLAMRRGLGDAFVGSCEQTLTVAELGCALEATDTAAVSGCLPSSAAN